MFVQEILVLIPKMKSAGSDEHAQLIIKLNSIFIFQLGIPFTNNLDPDPAWQNLRPDLDLDVISNNIHILPQMNITSGLIRIQTVLNSDGIPERIFGKSWF